MKCHCHSSKCCPAHSHIGIVMLGPTASCLMVRSQLLVQSCHEASHEKREDKKDCGWNAFNYVNMVVSREDTWPWVLVWWVHSWDHGIKWLGEFLFKAMLGWASDRCQVATFPFNSPLKWGLAHLLFVQYSYWTGVMDFPVNLVNNSNEFGPCELFD